MTRAARQLARHLADPRLGWLLFGLGLAVNLARLGSLLNVPGAPHPAEWGLHDFRDAIYYPVRAFLDGRDPYDVPTFRAHYPVWQHFPLYAPLTLVLHLPLGLLPYPWALALYGALGGAGLLALAALSLRLNGLALRRGPLLALTGALLLSRPGMMNFLLGQVSLEVVLATLLAWHWRGRRPWPAALALAFTSIKPTFALPLAVLLAADGRWRVLLRGGLLAALGNGLPLLWVVHAAGGVGPFLQHAQQNAAWFAQTISPLAEFARVDLPALLARLGGRPLPDGAVPFLLVAVLALAAWRYRRLRESLDEGERLALVVLAVLLCCYHQAYDLLLLTPAALHLARRALADGAPPRARLLAALLALPFANYLATAVATRPLAPAGPAWLAVTTLNGALLLAALALLATRPATRERQTQMEEVHPCPPDATPSRPVPPPPPRS